MLIELINKLVNELSLEEFARYIDSTLLRIDASTSDAIKLIEDARECGFKCAVLSPHHAMYVLSQGFAKDVRICSVVGFPMGYTSTKIKVLEAEELLVKGVEEIDIVMNIQAFKSGRYNEVLEDLVHVVDKVRSYGAIAKVIIESPLLTTDEKSKAVELVIQSGAHFVKTSTGILAKTSLHDVYMLVKLARNRIKVKAAGGFRSVVDALLAIAIGAERIGTSTATQLYREFLELKSKSRTR